MDSSNSLTKINDFFTEVLEFMVLNVMWILCTLLGGIVFGWAPSTVAILTIMRDKIRKSERAGVIKTFWKIYCKEFKAANKLGILLTIVFIIAFINKQNFDAQPEAIFGGLSIISLIVMLAVILVSVFVFPLYVHYDIEGKKYLPTALTMMVFRPFVTICQILWAWMIYSISMLIPGLIPVLAIAVYAYGVMAISYQFFMRNEDRLKAEQRAKEERAKEQIHNNMEC